MPFKENVTIHCNSMGRKLRGTATSGFRQCVYDPKPVSIDLKNSAILTWTYHLIYFLFLCRVCRTIGSLVYSLHVNESIADLRYLLRAPNTATFAILNFTRHSFSDAKIHSVWPDKRNATITLYDAKRTEFGTSAIYDARDPFAKIQEDL